MAEHDLITRLIRFRTAVKRRLVAYGICAVGAGGTASVLTVLATDWLLTFPAPLRLVVAALFVAGFVAASWHWVLKPLRMPLGIDELAGRLERHFGDLEDRLTSTVEFITHESAGSPAMMRSVIETTEDIARPIRFESALSAKPLVRMAAFLAVGACALTTVSFVSRSWVTTGVYRYLDPFGAHAWPTRVSIVPLTGNQTIPIGEFAPVRLRIERGLDPDLRVVVRLREPGGRTQSLTMQREGDDIFATTIDSVTTDLEYFFEAGDASTSDHPFRITAIPRPAVVEMIAVVEPPGYAPDRPSRVLDPREGPIDATVGGYVTVELRASKPIAAGSPAHDQVGLRFADGGWTPLEAEPDDPQSLRARFAVTTSTTFRIHLIDEHGLSSHDEVEYVVRARPDDPPVVTITDPRGVMEVTPIALVRLTGRVEDEFGIGPIALEAGGAEGSPRKEIDLTTSAVRTEDQERVRADITHEWSMRSMDVIPGDVIVYALRAADNYALDGAPAHVARSFAQRIKIISEAEFELRIRSDLAQLEGRVRESALDQGDLGDQIVPLIREVEDAEPLTAAEKRAADAVIGGQGRLATRLRDLARRFDGLRERIERNRAGDSDAQDRMAGLSRDLVKIAAGPVTAAANELSRAVDSSTEEEQAGHVVAAKGHQQDAADRLRSMLQSLARWGDFENLLAKTRDLADRQQVIREKTTSFGKRTIGKRPQDLNAEEASELAGNARRQHQVADDLDQLLRNMADLAKSLQSKDPAGAESVDAALRAARASGVSRQLQQASEAMKQNRAAAAVMNQQQAEESLRRMIDALRQRATRELAMLRKQLEKSEEAVARLLQEQRLLEAATVEAGRLDSPSDILKDYARRQRDVQRNTRMLAEELLDTPRAADAGRILREAAIPMRNAQASLNDGSAESAAILQGKAIATLEQALEALETLARHAEDQALRQSLARIQAALEEMLHAQIEVNTGVERLRETVADARGVVTRAEARIATRLARSQSRVRENARALKPILEQVAVFRWALERVIGWMSTTQEHLEARRIDEALVEITVRISDELARLIDAIRQTQAMPLDQAFTDASGGGSGGGGKPGQSQPVPTLAELFVLRAMQQDLIDRTHALDVAGGGQDANEAQLRSIRRLGEDQEEVRRLTELVTRKARHR